MSPMPFCPSLLPWKKLTPVQVATSSARIGPGRRLVALRRLVERGHAHHELHRQQQRARQHEADQRREQQRLGDLDRLAPVHARGRLPGGRHQLVRQPHAHDRADQRMRRAVRDAERPGAQVPDDRRDQQREDHRIARAAADLQDQLHRQQADDRIRNRPGRRQHAEEVERPRPHHRDQRRQAVGVDHGGDRVGRVMEPVDELEPQRDQQGEAQQHQRADRQPVLAHVVDIGVDAERRIAQPEQQHRKERQRPAGVRPAVQLRPGRGYPKPAIHRRVRHLAPGSVPARTYPMPRRRSMSVA